MHRPNEFGPLLIWFLAVAACTGAAVAQPERDVPADVLAAETARIERMREATEATIAVFGPEAAGLSLIHI